MATVIRNRSAGWLNVLIVWSLLGTAAHATTLNVDNSNPRCSNHKRGNVPFCAIGAAAKVAKAGDTVIVAAGVYQEQVVPQHSGTVDQPIVFTNAKGGSVSIAGKGCGFKISDRQWITVKNFVISDTDSYGVQVERSSHIVLDHLHVTRTGQPIKGALAMGWSYIQAAVGLKRGPSTRKGIYLKEVTDSVVQQNIVEGNSDSGIFLGAGTKRVHVVGNTVSHNARGYPRAASGIEFWDSSENVIEANIIFDNEDSGVQVRGGSHDNYIVNNVIYRNGDHGIDLSNALRHRIVANTLYRNLSAGINIERTPNTIVSNNITVDNGAKKSHANIQIDGDSLEGTTLDYDLVYMSMPARQIVWGSQSFKSLQKYTVATGFEKHGVEANPKFVDPAAGDFRLRQDSPAIDSAHSGIDGALKTDIALEQRSDVRTIANTGTGPRTYDDRGAHEYRVSGGYLP